MDQNIGTMITQILPLLLLITVILFITIMPQRKREKQVKQMLEEMKKGDWVRTIGGVVSRDEICEFLAKNRGQVFSKEQILEAVFGFDNESNDSTIITHIKNIRAKFADYDYIPIKTVWGIGYKWEE